ncbi:hypothetical protein IJ102_01105 [Candidatus Saccharibacteria bacterium]|nr:hypothetical protein [Candidatus Saccharibacteria bacterium]
MSADKTEAPNASIPPSEPNPSAPNHSSGLKVFFIVILVFFAVSILLPIVLAAGVFMRYGDEIISEITREFDRSGSSTHDWADFSPANYEGVWQAYQNDTCYIFDDAGSFRVSGGDCYDAAQSTTYYSGAYQLDSRAFAALQSAHLTLDDIYTKAKLDNSTSLTPNDIYLLKFNPTEAKRSGEAIDPTEFDAEYLLFVRTADFNAIVYNPATSEVVQLDWRSTVSLEGVTEEHGAPDPADATSKPDTTNI